MTTTEISLDDLAELPGARFHITNLVKVLDRTSGWRIRQQIGNLLSDIEECAGAARCCEERKDWNEMLRHMSDGLNAADKLQMLVGLPRPC